MGKNINVLIKSKNARRAYSGGLHFFAGANTGSGFHNLFDQIVDPRGNGFLYVLKGGPGTGKSTLMKTVGRTFLEAGEDVEFFYCSSDYSSLDGVRLTKHNIAIVDGTAPHVTEAQMPGIKDKIVNLGEFIGTGISEHEREITALLAKKRAYFDLAYAYINAASTIYSANLSFSCDKKDKVNAQAAAKKIMEYIDFDRPNRLKQCGRVRRLYLNVVADGGIYSLKDKNKYQKVITLSYSCATNERILDSLVELLTKEGLDVITFGEVLAPNSLSSILIPSLGTLICKACGEPQENQSKQSEQPNNLQTEAKAPVIKERDKFSTYNDQAINRLLKQAASALASAKKQHKRVEAFYIPSMDFESISLITQNLIEEINTTISSI